MKNYLAALLLTLSVLGLPPFAYGDDATPDVRELFSRAMGGDEEALIALRQKADQNDDRSQLVLGFLYANGQGVTQDYAQASVWYRKAADQGDAAAQLSLGLMYVNGQGVTQDYTQAWTLIRKAAIQDLPDAQFNLGYMYENGDGVTQNYAEALAWYRKAADQNYDAAKYNLGLLYYNGQGVTINYVLAYQWFFLAKSASDQDPDLYSKASFKLDELIPQMTPDQITQAQKAAADWLALHPQPQAQ